ncbi:MAG: SDR family oxidoreductase [Actinomycetota bacterium]
MTTNGDREHAFITGGGSGIGLACARRFLDDGAAVTIMGRNAEKLETARRSLASLGTVRIAAGDVADEDDVRTAVESANEHQPLTIAVANAGTGTAAPVTAMEQNAWNEVMEVNLNGTFHTFKHAGAAVAASGGGALCAISSIAGARSHRLMSAYCASKAAVDMLVQVTADELGADGVRVNSVRPGLVETEISAPLRGSEAILHDYLNCMPIRRVGTVEDVAGAVHFLCGPGAAWITGVNLSVDGGHHLRRGPSLDGHGT